jgi:hypothetical protein
MDIISLILISITFIGLLAFQIVVWCQIISGFVAHYKINLELRRLMPLKIMEKIREQDEDSHRGYT